MTLNIAAEVAALQLLTAAQLRGRFVELFGEATHTNNKVWLIRRIAWRLQALALGDLSQRARDRAAQLANDADLRLTTPRTQSTATPVTPTMAQALPAAGIPAALPSDPRLPPPGTVITRLYKGQQLEVTILPSGFVFQGKFFPSLSALAKAITGAHCNGFAFFRLTQPATSR
jgi:hypothetical protein